MNRLKNDANLSPAASWRLAAAYAIMGREKAAAELAKRDYSITPYRDMGYSYGSDLRDRAMILETMTYLKDNERAGELILDIAKDLSIGWHSTQSRAYALLAIGKSIGEQNIADKLECTVTINGKPYQVNSGLPIHDFEIETKELKSGLVSVENTSNRPIFVSFIQSGIPTESKIVSQEKDLRMSVEYVDMKGNPINISSLKQGTDFKAIVRITHPGVRKAYKEVALNQIFPSGWQIINTRLANDYQLNANLDYQDFRDDRVYSYFSLNSRETVTIEILLNATFLGRFYQPAIFCAPMYDERISAIKAGGWVEVVKK